MRATPKEAPRRTPRGLVAIIMGVLLSACGSAGLPSEPVPEPASGGAAEQADEGPSQAEDGGAADAFEGHGSLLERRIVKTGELTVEVADVSVAVGQVRAMALELDGYVGGSQAGTLEERATITLRIPSHRFDEALARLHELDGQVLAERTREDDVTGAIVDLEARIENLQASEAQYRLLLERAEEIDDILNVQVRLDQVRGEIEQLEAQLEQLSGQADLATMTVTLVPRVHAVNESVAAWDPGATLNEALGALLAIGQGLATALIWLGVVWVPILLVLAIVAMLVLRGLVEVRRRAPLADGAAPGGEPPTNV